MPTTRIHWSMLENLIVGFKCEIVRGCEIYGELIWIKSILGKDY